MMGPIKSYYIRVSGKSWYFLAFKKSQIMWFSNLVNTDFLMTVIHVCAHFIPMSVKDSFIAHPLIIYFALAIDLFYRKMGLECFQNFIGFLFHSPSLVKTVSLCEISDLSFSLFFFSKVSLMPITVTLMH